MGLFDDMDRDSTMDVGESEPYEVEEVARGLATRTPRYKALLTTLGYEEYS